MAGVMLITGGSRGIGAATARLAAQRGYKVALNYVHNKAAAEKLAREIGALAIAADVGPRPMSCACSGKWTSSGGSACW